MERLVWRLIGRTGGKMRWTDDTQMSIDLAETLIENPELNPDALALRFARSYRWSRGYGPGVSRLLRRIARGDDWRQANRSVFPKGSFGNGGAMRAPIVGLAYANRSQQLVEAARQSACVTHAHPVGIDAAVLVAVATFEALKGQPPIAIVDAAVTACETTEVQGRLESARGWITTGASPDVATVRRELGNRIVARDSCVTAVYLALRFLDQSFDELQRFVRHCGGDVDTIGAMSGAIWGAANGLTRLPSTDLDRLEARDRLLELSQELFTRCGLRQN